MKRTTAILLLIILLFHAGGILLVCKIQLLYVKKEMQQTLVNSNTRFQKMTLSLDEYHKCKINSREIFVAGKMYDIKSITFIDDEVELLVIHDSKEDGVLKKMKEFVNRAKQPKNDFANKWRKLLSLNYLSAYKDELSFIPFHAINVFHVKKTNLASLDLDISTPPPQLA